MRKYTKIYNDDMAELNVLMPDIQPKATEYIPEMIELIEDLISKVGFDQVRRILIAREWLLFSRKGPNVLAC